MKNPRTQIPVLVVAVACTLLGSGCGLYSGHDAATQKWLIVDGCMVQVEGTSVENWKESDRILEVGDDCWLKVETEEND